MSGHLDERYAALALGLLEVEEETQLRAELARDPAAQAEVAALEAQLADLALVLEPEPVSGRSRLLQATAQLDRLGHFATRLAELVDATKARALTLLRLIDEPDEWTPLFPGCQLLHIRPGPAVAGADVGLVRLAPGASFPHHKHLGTERVLVLQGSFEDSSGAVVRAGELVPAEAESAHSFTALPGEELVYAVVVYGVEIPGVELEEPPEDALH